MIETHRSFVNRWECDENNHMNVQFYIKRFDEADRILDAICGSNAATPSLRHVRYHRELREGDSAVVQSAWISGENGKAGRVHIMTNSETGEICTTAMDRLAKELAGAEPCLPDEAPQITAARPRGLDGGSIQKISAERMLESDHALVSNYSIVESGDTTKDGILYCNRIVSRFTDGAPHVWSHTGLTTDRLQKDNQGRVAVEMKVMPLAESSAGTALRLISKVADRNEKTFRILHQLQEVVSGRIIALGEVRCLIMDLEKRRAVALPEDFLNY